MTTTIGAPSAIDTERVTQLVTLAAYERLRVELALAHGTELVTWDEQNNAMRADLRETVEPVVLDTVEAIAELGYAVVPRSWLGGPRSDSTVLVVDEPLERDTRSDLSSPDLDIDLPGSIAGALGAVLPPGPGTNVDVDDSHHLRDLVAGAGSAAVAIVRLPQSAWRPITRAVARVLGPAA